MVSENLERVVPGTLDAAERLDTKNARRQNFQPFYRAGADGSTTYFIPGFPVKGLWVANFATVAYNVTFDTGEVLNVPAGAHFVIIPPFTTVMAVAAASAGTGNLLMAAFPRSPVPMLYAANLNSGGSGGAVTATITGPLASGDAVAAGLPLESGSYIYNGATWDRLREVIGDAQAATGMLAAGGYIYNGATWDRIREVLGDAQAVTGLLAVLPLVYNGTTYDRGRSPSGDGMAATGLPADHAMVFNGATYDRMRSIGAGDAYGGTGLLAADLYAFNGTTYDRLKETSGRLWTDLIPAELTGGFTLARFHATTGAQGNLKASAAKIGGMFDIYNTSAGLRYFHIYNSTSATPITGALVPVYTKALASGAGANFWFPGVGLGTGLSYGVTTDNAATPATAATAGDVQGTIGYL